MTFKERYDILENLLKSIQVKSDKIRSLKLQLNSLIDSKLQDQFQVQLLRNKFPDRDCKYCDYDYNNIDKYDLITELKNYKRIELDYTIYSKYSKNKHFTRSIRVDNKGNYYIPVIDMNDERVYLGTSDFINFYRVDKAKGKKVTEFYWFNDYSIAINNFVITRSINFTNSYYIIVYKIL